MRASPFFRALVLAPRNARGLRTGHAPPCGSSLAGTPPASVVGRRHGSCTGASTRNPYTGVRCSNSRRRGWTVLASSRFSAGCSCSTDQPGKGPSSRLTCRMYTGNSRRSFVLPFSSSQWLGTRPRWRCAVVHSSGFLGPFGEQRPKYALEEHIGCSQPHAVAGHTSTPPLARVCVCARV